MNIMLLHGLATSFLLGLGYSLATGGEWGPPISEEEMANAIKTVPVVEELPQETLDMICNHPDDEDNHDNHAWNGTSSRAYTSGFINKPWPGGILPYRISSNFNSQQRAVIAQAMYQISSNVSCVSFVGRTDEQFFVSIVETKLGCFASSVGRSVGRSEHIINLDASYCFKTGVVIHELLHILGCIHEHQRPDRDNHVEIIWDHIESDESKRQFYRDLWTGQTLQWGSSPNCSSSRGQWDGCITYREVHRWPDLGYDLDSVMHYSRTAFGYPRTTIRALNGRTDFGQRLGLSSLDIKKLRRAYGCDTIPAPMALMIAGGQGKSDVEGISLVGSSNFTCDNSIANAPNVTKGAAGLTDSLGRPMLCGGKHNTDNRTCYIYDRLSDTWRNSTEYFRSTRLGEPRHFAQAVRTSDTHWTIFGGQGSIKSELYNLPQGVILLWTDMPARGLNKLCAANSPSSHSAYMINGKKAWSYLNYQFTRLPDCPVKLRRRACGVVSSEDGSDKFVVVGGTPGSYQASNATYIFHSSNGTWTRGQDYPRPVYAASSVPFNGSFLVIGGISRVNPEPTEIFRYEPSDGSWVDTELRMSKPRKFPVPIITNYVDICG